MNTLQRHALIAFGTFQVDIGSGELRKAGMRVKLQTQPFRALVALLSRPGEVITREELQHEIWGPNTSVDFERGLASAINKLREALGDSAENPRYIETLAKRGYRFVAPVVIEPSAYPELAAYSQIEPALPNGETARSLPLTPEISATVSVLPVTTAVLPPRNGPAASKVVLLRRSTAAALLVLVLVLLGVLSLIAFRALRTPGFIRPNHIKQLTRSSEIFAGLPDSENLPVLVTDGPRIYAPTLSGGSAQISSLEPSDARMQPLNIPAELGPVSIAALSQDGSKLLLRSRRSRGSEQPLWIVPTSGTSALRVGEVLAHDATWMPDAKSILYAEGSEIGVVQLDTGTTTVFAKLPGRAFWPRWSPNGRLLRFTLVDPITHTSSLWELEASTHQLHRLNFPELSGLALCCGSWTPDGATYVLESSSTEGTDIWAVGMGAHPAITQLTNGPLRYLSPLLGRDGRTVYFVGLDQPADVRLYDKQSQSFVPAPAYLAQAQRVTYSRNGAWVAWTDGESRLWRARSADGAERVQLTPDDLEVFLAQWSPDGNHLVLMARKQGETWQIFDVSAEGGIAHLLLKDRRNLADPDWSADGKQLVLGREAEMMGKENGPHDLQVFDLASHKMQALPGSENLFSPRWSPDGRWIAALSMDQTQLALYDVQRHSWRTLFVRGAADPVWSSDSKSVYFHAFSEPGSPILRLDLNGTAESVADLTKLALPIGGNYFFSGITPTGSPLVKPRIGTGNLYSVRLSR